MTAYELRISDWSSDVCSSDLQYLALEASYQRVFAPFRPLHQGRHRRARLAPFADALERLVILEFEQRIVPGGLRRIVEQVAAEDAHQSRPRPGGRPCQDQEVALRAQDDGQSDVDGKQVAVRRDKTRTA